MRATVQRHLLQAGRAGEAALAADPAATLVDEMPSPVAGWRLLLFNAFPHSSASFHVAVGPGVVALLTGSPQNFATMLKSAGFTARTPAQAVAVARAYLETTRPMTELIVVVGGVDDIKWLPRPTAGEKRSRDRISRELRSVLRAPEATEQGEAYVVTGYVQRGDTVERRTVTLGKGGSVSERAEKIAQGLPVPYVL